MTGMSHLALPELRAFDYSVRVRLASSALCGDARASVALKLRLRQLDGSDREVLLELDERQLEAVLKRFAAIRQALRATDVPPPL